MTNTPHLYPHATTVTAEDRARLLGQRGCVLWMTGLSGSGKSTVAHALEARLIAGGHAAFVLDGDTVRTGLNVDLGFAPEDRAENIRRVAAVAALFADAGLVAIASFISPYAADRGRAREAVGEDRFLEVHVSTPLAVCEARDPKGLYQRARNGEIQEFTGVSAPYEAPERPALAVDTTDSSLDDCVDRLLALLEDRGFVAAPGDLR
jgi:adenylyl-sulfate kinase